MSATDGEKADPVIDWRREECGYDLPRPTPPAPASPAGGELEAEVAELTKALTGLTCGGSEFFTRKGDRFVADTKACVDWVRRAREDAHRRWADEAKKNRALQADNARLREALEKIANAAPKEKPEEPDYSCGNANDVAWEAIKVAEWHLAEIARQALATKEKG